LEKKYVEYANKNGNANGNTPNTDNTEATAFQPRYQGLFPGLGSRPQAREKTLGTRLTAFSVRKFVSWVLFRARNIWGLFSGYFKNKTLIGLAFGREAL